MDPNIYWIIIIFILIGVIIIFIILWINAEMRAEENIKCECYGNYGFEVNRGGDIVRRCGENRNLPCIFLKNTIQDCVDECNGLDNICNGFTYNPDTNLMEIIDINNIYNKNNVGLYIKQNGQFI